MNYKIQLLSLLLSFIYGFLFYFTSLLNYKIIKKFNVFFKYLLTFIYMFIIALIYVFLFFKINNGVVHDYFLLMVLCGFLFSYYLKKMLIKNVKFYEIIVKRKYK